MPDPRAWRRLWAALGVVGTESTRPDPNVASIMAALAQAGEVQHFRQATPAHGATAA